MLYVDYLIARPLRCSRTIIDGRLAFEIVQGFAIMFGFTTPEGLQHWGKMMLEKQEGLVKRVTEMESATIGVNFGFEDQVS